MHIRSALGKKGEDLIANYLTQRGFSIVDRNYARRMGEIDLIARKKDLLIFIEVKMRTAAPSDFDLSEVITPSKQRKIISVAKEYIARYAQDRMICRFDVALIQGPENSAQITYLEDAFREHEY